MNEIFDIKRLWKLLQYEVVNYIPNFFKSLLIFASVIAAVWIFSLTVDFDILPYSRVALVTVLFTLAIILSPFIVYKDINNRKKGYIYAMIPASTLEKLLSMIVLCIVIVPILTYAVLTATDLLLWLLTKTGMGTFHYFELYNPFTDDIATVVIANNSYPAVDTVLYFVNIIAYTIMFNTIFRKNKVLKTILFNITMTFATVIFVAFIANITTPEFWEELFRPFADMEYEDVIRYAMNIGRCANVLFTALFLAIAYFRIKRVNY